MGLREGDHVAVLSRNHRGFVDTALACAKLGAHLVLLNTDFAGPQLVDVVEREQVTTLVHDAEFADVATAVCPDRRCFLASSDMAAGSAVARLDDVIAASNISAPPMPNLPGRVIMLTSGTTGTPKGAQRRQPTSIVAAASLLSRIPLRAHQPIMIATPLFHALGFVALTLGLALSAKLVVHRRFDPASTFRAVSDHKCGGLIVAPVMLKRMLDDRTMTNIRCDLSALRVVLSGGAALSPDLSRRSAEILGDVLYNLYGSTEVAWATIATPQDLYLAPGTVGRPPLATSVRLYNDTNTEVPLGTAGRIFVRNHITFDGYTGGGGKDVIDGFIATGDVGHFDASRRLFVDGREDDMIVCGGENVFPMEIEHLLSRHAAVRDVAVVGVTDPQFQYRLRAFVVLEEGVAATEQALTAYVRANLARYKVPRDVIFCNELPRGVTGKIFKDRLCSSADLRHHS
jgi:acyl-CoA synthetase (AMP-forming)/AMP-acid ligase II